MKLASLAVAALAAAAVAHRLTELNVQSLGVCWAIGMGAGIVVLLLTKEARHG